MRTEIVSLEVRIEARIEDAVQPVLVGAMIGCMALSLVWAAERYVSGWNAIYLALFCGLTAIEAGYSYRFLGGARPHSPRAFQFRLLELASLFVLRQMWGDIVEGHGVLQGGVPHFDPAGAWMYIPIFLSWLLATNMASTLDRLGEPPRERDPRYVPAQRHLAMCVFIGGILLLVVAGLTRTHPAAWTSTARISERIVPAQVSGPVWNVLLYFLLGMMLLGQAHYAALRQQWREQQLTIAGGLESRWLRYVLAMVAFVTVLAFVLPTAHTARALDILQMAWNLSSSAAAQIGTLATLLSVKLAGLLGLHHTHEVVQHGPGPLRRHPWLVGRHPTSMTTPCQCLPAHVTHVIHHQSHSVRAGGGHLFVIGNWMGALKALALWLAVVASVVYRLHGFRRRQARNSRTGGLWGGLRRFLEQIRSVLGFSLRPYLRATADQVQQGLGRESLPPLPAARIPRLVRLRPRSPREQVLHSYLAMLRVAKQHGFSHRPAHTPYQIGAALACDMPEAAEDVHRLTEAFVHARYSGRAVERGLAARVLASWRRIRIALHRRRRVPSGDSGSPRGAS